jgi:hypothetical protein
MRANSAEKSLGTVTTARRGPALEVMPATEVRATLNHNFQTLRRDVHDVGDSVHRVERTAEKISKQLSESDEAKASQGQKDAALAERLEQILDTQNAKLHQEYTTELEKLRNQNKLDTDRLRQLEKDYGVACLQSQILAKELAETQNMMETRSERSDTVMELDDQEVVMGAFYKLRDSVLEFARGSAIHTGHLSDASQTEESLFEPEAWNRVSAHQRKQRVMAKIFHLLFRRILRPGLRVFGVQAFLRNEEHHAISASEAQLRALERDLEAQGGKVPIPPYR